jgi:hypothetical protein
MAKQKPATAQFLNVDMEVSSRSNLEPLVKALGKKVDVLYAGRHRGMYHAYFELARRIKNADTAIRGFCKLIEALPVDARKLWDGASKRDFSIGVRSAVQAPVYDTVIQAKTVKGAADLNARIVFTLYPPEMN